MVAGSDFRHTLISNCNAKHEKIHNISYLNNLANRPAGPCVKPADTSSSGLCIDRSVMRPKHCAPTSFKARACRHRLYTAFRSISGTKKPAEAGLSKQMRALSALRTPQTNSYQAEAQQGQGTGQRNRRNLTGNQRIRTTSLRLPHDLNHVITGEDS